MIALTYTHIAIIAAFCALIGYAVGLADASRTPAADGDSA